MKLTEIGQDYLTCFNNPAGENVLKHLLDLYPVPKFPINKVLIEEFGDAHAAFAYYQGMHKFAVTLKETVEHYKQIKAIDENTGKEHVKSRIDTIASTGTKERSSAGAKKGSAKATRKSS